MIARMKVLTTKEVAERLGVTDTRVRAMIVAGRLPAQNFGRAYMVQEADLVLVANRKPGNPGKKEQPHHPLTKKAKSK